MIMRPVEDSIHSILAFSQRKHVADADDDDGGRRPDKPEDEEFPGSLSRQFLRGFMEQQYSPSQPLWPKLGLEIRRRAC